MVGEMRDLETAEIAVRSALTGHLVFSTLHTNDAVGGITRLMDVGVEPFLISSAVRAFIAQRLVRRLCHECRRPVSPKQWESAGLFVPDGHLVYEPGGCEACRGTGYRGRTALYEICLVSPNLQELIQQKATFKNLRRLAREEGMITLREYGWMRVRDGLTSPAEVLRVTSAESEVAAES
jgi:type II secretory ATPase GspE/PulE/Tfp pilus assembly ATPase PilB-like protein